MIRATQIAVTAAAKRQTWIGPAPGYLFRGREFDVVTRQFPPAPFGTVGVANSLLGFIGIARIGTVGDRGPLRLSHSAPHHLVVFRPRFRLVGEDGRHCWGIFIVRTGHNTQILDFMLAISPLLTSGQGREGWNDHLG